MGKLRDYSVDMVPKFLMAGGQLVKVLIHTGVANYMEFKPVEGSFVYSSKAGKVCKVPSTPEDAMKSSLMGMMEKTRMMQFTLWVAKAKLSDRSTWVAGTMKKTNLALDTMTGDKFFAYWGLEKTTIEFLTHACCLYRDDSYKSRPAIELVQRMQVRPCSPHPRPAHLTARLLASSPPRLLASSPPRLLASPPPRLPAYQPPRLLLALP